MPLKTDNYGGITVESWKGEARAIVCMYSITTTVPRREHLAFSCSEGNRRHQANSISDGGFLVDTQSVLAN